jgi:PKD repeat protein
VTRRRIRSDEYQRPANRRPRIFPGRRFALGLVLTLGLLGCSAALAGADASSNVIVIATVYSPSGTTTDSVSVAALEANAGTCPQYAGQSLEELGLQGWVDVTLSPSGTQSGTWSLPTILGCLQTPVPISAVTGVTVIESDESPEVGPDSQLTPADLSPTGSDFNSSSEYPVVQALGSLNQYDRPWRGSPEGQPDYDFLDEVQGTQDDQPAPIAIEVFEGPPLAVTASASRTTVPVGTVVSFSATVSGADDTGLSYSWDFGGGAPSSTAAAPQTTFDATGQYDVTVQVTDAAGGGGGAEIPITVGSQPAAASGRHKQKGAGKSHKSHSATGPQKSSGKHAGGAAGKSKSDQSTTAGKTGTTSTSHTSTTPSSTSTTPSSTSTTPSRPAASGSSAAPTTAARSPAPNLPRHSSPLTKPAPHPLFEGPPVTGELISDVTPLPAGTSPLVHSVRAPAATAPPARQATAGSLSLVPALATALVIALLLGLGASRELHGRRSWRALLLRS